MANFGWKAGLDYCPHLSTASTAWFSCVLGMPWASDADGDPVVLDQSTCKSGFDDWLTPWHRAAVRWLLLAKDETVTPVQWKQVGGTVPVTQGLALTPAQRQNFVEQCAARLHFFVRRHNDAMGVEPLGGESPVFTYPLVSPGIALLPSYLSDSTLGTSALLRVDRASVPANAQLVAVPVFDLVDGAAAPTMEFASDQQVPYAGPSRTVDGQKFSFHSVMVEPIVASAYAHDGTSVDAPHRFVKVRSRIPDRQLYAGLSRQFSPFRLWIAAIAEVKAPTYTGKEFCALLVRLLGAGEDEMDAGKAVGSIYEMLLPTEMYKSVFEAKHADRGMAAASMLQKFEAGVANDPKGEWVSNLLARFARHLGSVGLQVYRDSLLQELINATNDANSVSVATIKAATGLCDVLHQESGQARAGWGAWLAAALEVVAPDAAMPERLAAAVETLLDGAKVNVRDATKLGAAVLDEDVVRLLNGQIDYAAGFWEKVHDEVDDVQAALVAAKSLYTVAMTRRLAASELTVAAQLSNVYDEACRRVVQAAQQIDPQADDPPLQLAFRPAATAKQSNSIRGCLLALRVGVPRAANQTDWKAHAWITSAFVRPSLGAGKFDVEFEASGGGKAVFCDTQGATHSDGLEEQVAVYNGVPLLAAHEEASPNPSAPEIFQAVPAAGEVPALAYGARYSGFSVTVDNAGAIMEPQMRGAHLGEPLEPLQPGHFDSNGTGSAPEVFQYLSRRPPGAPIFAGFCDLGVKDDTLTLRASDSEPVGHHVAVLCSGDGYAKQCPSQEIHVFAPSVGAGFIQRWLAADSLVDANDAFRWTPVRAMTVAAVRALASDAQSGMRAAMTHPAVSTVEISAKWFTGNPLGAPHDTTTVSWQVEHFRGGHWLDGEHLTLQIVQAAHGAPYGFMIDGSSRTATIVVPKGMQVRLEARSLIPNVMLDGVNARLQRSALVTSATSNVRPYEPHPGGNACQSREPQVLWIESLPEIPADQGLFDLSPTDWRLRVPNSAAVAQEIFLDYMPAQARSAHWIARVRLEHKRWQWSGYPIRFPASGSLQDWLPLYAGVSDAMPDLPSTGFSTTLNPVGQWELQSLVMTPVPLPHVRPANHMGIVVTAIPRFAALLDAATLERAKSAYIFDHVPGVRRRAAERLGTPIWTEAIPMPRTIRVDSAGQVTELSRGNLLMLADPLYDTADTAAFGGIAERIELDVVATWDVAKTPAAPRIEESGPNPIFHAAPPVGEAQAALEIEPVFGLSYDGALGGRAAQSGVVLRPIQTEGRWTLAKCRLRRYLLPELLLDAELPGERYSAPVRWSGTLGLRQVEKTWVPEDFVIYSDVPVSNVQVAHHAVILPTTVGTFLRAYLVTWHRERWAQAAPTWRPLVRLYERNIGFADWTLKAQVTPFDTGVTDYIPQGKAQGRLALSYEGNGTPYHIHVSDFTESRWLTFIGSFGLETPPSSHHVEIVQEDGGYTLRPVHGAAMPMLGAKQDLRPSLLLIFAPQLDLMRGRIESEGGELVGVYAAKQVVPGAAVRFDETVLACDRPSAQCQALLIQLQRHNVQKTEHVIAAGQWNELVECLFPAQELNREASLRFLPEYLGPMPIQRQ